MLDEYVDSMSEHGIRFRYDDKSLGLLAEKSFGGKSGARDLRNLIRKEVEDKISLSIIENNGTNMGKVFLTIDGDNKLKVMKDN